MELGISGRKALVFGASGGLGRAVAMGLAAEGAVVALAGRNIAELENTREAIGAAGGNAFVVDWDLADLDGAAERFERLREAFGDIDILFNNTGGPPPTTAAGQDIALWRKHFDLMVASVIAVTDLVLPAMRSRGFGRIITSTSSGVIAPIPNLAVSNALRVALVGWSKTLAREVGKDGITVNVMVPGRIDTGRVRALDKAKADREKRDVEAVTAESTSAIPVGRYGRPDEYAAAASFLASVQASYITGTVLRVDGGLVASL